MELSLYTFILTTLKDLETVTVDGESVTEFTKGTFRDKQVLKYDERPIMITKEYNGRPDLISKVVYGSEDYTDLLLYFNGIGNPFMVQEGMVLKIPTLDSMILNIDKGNKEKKNKSKEALNKKLPAKDRRRLENAVEGEIKAPNMVAEGTTPVVASGGKIELGTNVIDKKCNDNLSNTQLLSEQVRKAVKDKFLALNKPKVVQHGGVIGPASLLEVANSRAAT